MRLMDIGHIACLSCQSLFVYYPCCRERTRRYFVIVRRAEWVRVVRLCEDAAVQDVDLTGCGRARC